MSRLSDVVVAVVVVFAELAFVPAVFDVFPQLEPEPVRIDLSRMRRDGAGMMVGKIDHLGVVQRAFGHDLRVPVSGPAFVHDLGLGLRREVVRLFANHPQDIALPVFQRRIFDQE